MPSEGAADVYDIARFVATYREAYHDAANELRSGRRWLRHVCSVFPSKPHVERGVELDGPVRSRFVLRDGPALTTGTEAARAFLRYPPTQGGVHLRRDYHALCQLLLRHVVESDDPPVGPVSTRAGTKVFHSLLLFHAASMDGVAPEIHAVTAQVLPWLPAKWPLPESSTANFSARLLDRGLL